MNIRELLEKKGRAVRHVDARESVETAVRLLMEEQTGAMIVMEKGRPVGIFAERDVLRAHMKAPQKSLTDIPVQAAMTNKLIVAEPDDPVEDALGMMIRADIRHLPVIEDKKIIAMLTMGDLVRYQLGRLSSEIHYLQDYISELQEAGLD